MLTSLNDAIILLLIRFDKKDLLAANEEEQI